MTALLWRKRSAKKIVQRRNEWERDGERACNPFLVHTHAAIVAAIRPKRKNANANWKNDCFGVRITAHRIHDDKEIVYAVRCARCSLFSIDNDDDDDAGDDGIDGIKQIYEN